MLAQICLPLLLRNLTQDGELSILQRSDMLTEAGTCHLSVMEEVIIPCALRTD